MARHPQPSFRKNLERLEDYQTHGFGGLTFGCIGRIQKNQAHEQLIWRGWWIEETPEIWLEEDDVRTSDRQGSHVLVFHDKPHVELADEDVLCRVVRRVQPRLVLHGHMHRYEVTEPLEGTRVVSLPPCDPPGPVVLGSGAQTKGPVTETFVLDTEMRTLWHQEHRILEW